VAGRMQAAAAAVGVGPMAAVAGTMAQMAVEAAIAAGAEEAVVENGGDVVLASPQPVTVALYAGDSPLSGRLAFRFGPQAAPVSVCSSSGRMGHSLSFGLCDLATVVAADAALADAAATLACNLVEEPEDSPGALERIRSLAGISGLLLVKGDKVGMAGRLPELVRAGDPRFQEKITRDRRGGPLPFYHDIVTGGSVSFRCVTGNTDAFEPGNRSSG
jgi:ApbE superfamily uncharacterized protein (UPF0280 family)